MSYRDRSATFLPNLARSSRSFTEEQTILNDPMDPHAPSIKKPPLPISHEFDLVCLQHKGRADVDRSNWLQRVLENNPEIKILRECLNPVARAAAFARLYLPTNRLISHELLLSLISQHLRTLGLSETQASLHSEWGSDFKIPPHKLYSQLAILVQRGVHRAERFWELAIPSIHACESLQATQTALDEEISRTIGAAPNVIEDLTPMRSEDPGDSRFVKFDPATGEPIEASLNQLIFWLTTPGKGSQDTSVRKDTTELTNALVLTISSYASPKIFFTKLKDRWAMIKEELKEEEEKMKTTDQQTQESQQSTVGSDMLFVKLFKEWIKWSINDMEPQIVDAAIQFTEQELKPVQKYWRLCENIFQTKSDGAAARLKQLEQKAPEVLLGRCTGLWKGEFSLFDLPAEEFARQLTVWSSTRYYAIKRCELLDCAWDKPRLRYRAPNVIALTQHFNRLSEWVQYSILSEKSWKKRIGKMEHLVEVARQLFENRNYYDAMGIVGGFDGNAMFRCKAHFQMMNQKSQEILNLLREKCDPDGNFKNLRALYEQATTHNHPALPYIGVLLSDLFKYYEATQTFCEKLINVRKCKGVYKMISKIEEFTRSRYNFLPIDQVQVKIDDLKSYEEDMLISMSFEVEKDGATPDDIRASDQ